MRTFKHYSGATVTVEDNGKKHIHKYEIEFKDFTELRYFELYLVKNGFNPKYIDIVTAKELYKDFKRNFKR